MTEQEHNFCLNCSQLSLSMISLRLFSTNVLAATQIVPCHSGRQTQVYSVLENVEEKYTADSTISKIRKVQHQCECEGEGRWRVMVPGEVQVSWPSPGPSLHQ